MTPHPDKPKIGHDSRLESLLPGNLLLTGLCYVAGYVGLDYISFIEPFEGYAITPWSPGQGLALAVVLVSGTTYAPFVLAAPAVASFVVRSGSAPAFVLLAEGLLIGGVYLLVGGLARRRLRIDLRLTAVRDALLLVATAAVAAALAGASYVGTLALLGYLESHQVAGAFGRFFIGDLIGCMVVTPLGLLLARRRQVSLGWEGAFQAVAIVLALAAIFLLPHASEYQLFYLLFVPLLWSTLRSGALGAALALAVIQIGLVVALQLQQGAGASLTSFQTLMIFLAATGLVFGTLVDEQKITLTRLANQQTALNRALRLRSMGEIATTLAHEVNQPVTSIKTFAGIALDALAGGRADNASLALGKIRSECDRASAIVGSTRDLLRRHVSRPQLLKTERVLGDVRDLMLDRLSEHEIALRSRIDPNADKVMADPVQVQQALYNILDNSIDAIASLGRGGTISVDVTAPNPTAVEFAVRDSGPGFPASVFGSALMPLVTTKADGTGIGLTIARSVAEAHGGALVIDHTADGPVVRLRLRTEAEAA